MPTIGVGRARLFEALRLPANFGDDDFQKICFEFGIELDEVTSERVMKNKEVGGDTTLDESREEIIYRIEVPANRYDLLCLEGLARALNIFLYPETEKPPQYIAREPVNNSPRQRLVIKAETGSIRPFAVAAVLRNMVFTETSYQSFIDLQEKLHQNLCRLAHAARKRTLVAIGTHDLDTIQGPFTYTAQAPEAIKFRPLNQAKEMTGPELMAHYANDNNIRRYLPIIQHAPQYPVIYDANGVVLSLPPIINGNHSKIKLATRNVFIECTGTDLTKAKIVLNTVLTMFAHYCAEPFTAELVDVVTESTGTTTAYPDFAYQEFDVAVDYINSAIGIRLDAAEILKLVSRMGLDGRLVEDASHLHVRVPPTRSDILHACDVMEDVAIAYGFDRVPRRFPPTNTIGEQLPVNKLSDLLRREVALAGYTEALTFALCSLDENFRLINHADDGSAVTIANPKTAEFQVARTSLLPGLLKTLSSNRAMTLPLKVFEISDVVLRDATTDVGAHNSRRLCATFYANTASFETVHGLLDRVMLMLNVPQSATGYRIQAANDEAYFPGRCAEVLYNGNRIGVFGIVHPDVSKNFELGGVVSALELEIEPFL